MKRSYVLMGGVWLVMGGACKAPSTPPPKPQLTWQQFVKQPGELTSCLSEAVKPACMDGSPLLHEPGQPAKPFVSPCVYHAPDAPAPPHGYIISAAQFNEESVPHAIQLTFAKPIELEEIVHKLGVEHLENRAPTERFTNHRKITYARWFSPVADPGKAWLIEAQELADSPGKAIDVTVHVNPFDDVSRIRKLMIQSGFDVIDPAHVPPISFHPAMTEQASYPLIVRQTEHGVLINDTILSVSPTSKLDASARERFLGHVTTSMAKRQKQAEILKQPRLSNMYLDLTQQTPTHRALTLWREALAASVDRVDVSVGVWPSRKGSYVIDGRARQRPLPSISKTTGEALAHLDSATSPRLEVYVGMDGLSIVPRQIEGVEEIPMQPVASCLVRDGLCLERVGERNDSLKPLIDAASVKQGDEQVVAMMRLVEFYQPHALQKALDQIKQAHPLLKDVFISFDGELPWQVSLTMLDLINLKMKAPRAPWDTSMLERVDDSLRFERVHVITDPEER